MIPNVVDAGFRQTDSQFLRPPPRDPAIALRPAKLSNDKDCERPNVVANPEHSARVIFYHCHVSELRNYQVLL